MSDDKVSRASCPRCNHAFDTDIALSGRTLVCPECACVFDPLARSTIHAENTDSTSPEVDPMATVQGQPNLKPGPSSGPSVLRRASVEIGTVIDPYKVQREIGRGAMGTVYLARDTTLQRDVALKFLAPELASHQSSRDRFDRECQTLAQLKPHQNVVTVYAKGEHHGVPFFAMEYVDGISVKDLLKREGKLAPATALQITQQTTKALSFVWKLAKLVHRDVKPSNMMLERDGNNLKLTDFGLAKIAADSDDTGLTKTGIILGTPDYLSPEQARGQKGIDFRSDIYALGASLFHMLSGKALFRAQSLADVIAAHLNTPPPDVNELVQGLPAELGPFMKRMLAKQADDRPDSYEIVFDVLESAMRSLKN